MTSSRYSKKLHELATGKYGYLFRQKSVSLPPTNDERLKEAAIKIAAFIEGNQRLPQHTSDNIDEFRLAFNLDGIRQSDNRLYSALTASANTSPTTGVDLSIFDTSSPSNKKRIVKSYNGADTRLVMPESDFSRYKIGFKKVRQEIEDGSLALVKFANINQLTPNHYFSYKNELCYVLSIDGIEKKDGYSQQRMTTVFENGTLSHMYKRSLAQRLYEETGFAILPNITTGHIYVLESLSEDPAIKSIPDLHKIGMVQTESVEDRIKNARNDPTYLMAPVRVVATYTVQNLSTSKVETMIHKFFGNCQVSLDITANNGDSVHPKEWYSIPIETIEAAIQLINDGEISKYQYDRDSDRITAVNN